MSMAMLRKLVKWRDYVLARVQARAVAAALLGSRPVRRILVVCYGNIYRSPFVEACLKTSCLKPRVLEIRSAGFHPREGRKVEATFRHIAETFNVDLALHRSRCIKQNDLDWADVVLIMDGHNYRLMHQYYHAYLEKCIWLGAVSSATPVIIEDPYRRPLPVQLRIARQLHAACAALGDRLMQTAIVP